MQMLRPISIYLKIVDLKQELEEVLLISKSGKEQGNIIKPNHNFLRKLILLREAEKPIGAKKLPQERQPH
jgi:hypothetical protein